MTKMLNPDQEPTNIQQTPNQDINDMYILYTYKLRQGTKIQIIGLSKVNKPNQNHEQAEKTKSETSHIIQSPFKDMRDKIN